MSRNYDREHWERSMDMVRSNQRDPHENNVTFAGAPGEGGVFSTATYGSGAEFYSVTGMYENPLMHNPRAMHRGEGPRNYRRSDDRIHNEICERLTQHPLIGASTTKIQVHNGKVTMTGEVLDRRMKYIAEDVVDDVFGVTEISNRLRVSRDRVA